MRLTQSSIEQQEKTVDGRVSSSALSGGACPGGAKEIIFLKILQEELLDVAATH